MESITNKSDNPAFWILHEISFPEDRIHVQSLSTKENFENKHGDSNNYLDSLILGQLVRNSKGWNRMTILLLE